LPIFLIICFAVLGIQFFFLILFLFAFYKKQPLSVQNPKPVSVIVCAHDEEENLRELIPMLLSQDHPEFEVIIVEDRSNDGTYDYLLQATQEDARLKMVRVINKPDFINGKKFGLTLGIKAARYDWLLLTDADCRPLSKHWIRRMTEVYDEKTQIVLGFSPYRADSGLLNSFIRFESLLTGIQFIGMTLLGKPYMGVGRNLVYTKSLFLNNKGFNNYLGVMGGDDDLLINNISTKQNTQLAIGGDAAIVSEPKRTWREFLNQKLRHLSVGKKYRGTDRFILGLFMLSWLATWFLVPFTMFSEWWTLMLALVIIRLGLLIWLVNQASKKLNSMFEVWKTPFLDIIFSFYYLVTGLRALVVKRIKWKN
jgi:glycosyltransferase involved in cell wall biosynthesis